MSNCLPVGVTMNSVAPAASGRPRHAALMCRTNGQMTRSVLEFARDGVEAGEAVLMASAGPVLQRLRSELGGRGGQVTWTGLPGAGTNPARIIAAIRTFAEEHRGRPIRCVQEPAWHLLPPDHLCEAIRYEALLNLALTGRPVSVLCAFDPRLDGRAAGSIPHTHPLVCTDGQWLPCGRFAASGLLPAECDQPLPAPPPSAAVLAFRDDQSGVRQLTAQCARLAGLAADRVTDLVVAVGELAANTLVHSGGPGTLRIWTAGGEILCQVEDGGRLSDPLAGSIGLHPADPGSGRGLWVVHQVCDLVQIRTGSAGTAIRLHMRLPPRDATRAQGCR